MTTFGRMSSSARGGRVGLVVFLAVAVLPAAAGLTYALLYSVGAVGLLSRGLTLEPWARVLSGAELWKSLSFSTAVAAEVVLVSAALGILVALALGKRLERGLDTALHVPLAVPAVVAGFLTFQLLSGAGLASRIAARLGMISEVSRFPSLVQEPLGVGIVVAHAMLASPFFALFFAALARSERIADFVELSSCLGARPGQTLSHVVLPILLRQATPTLLLFFVAVLGSYEIPLLLGVQSPQMLSVLVVRKNGLYDLAEKPEAYCVAILYSVFVLLLLSRVISREGSRA